MSTSVDNNNIIIHSHSWVKEEQMTSSYTLSTFVIIEKRSLCQSGNDARIIKASLSLVQAGDTLAHRETAYPQASSRCIVSSIKRRSHISDWAASWWLRQHVLVNFPPSLTSFWPFALLTSSSLLSYLLLANTWSIVVSHCEIFTSQTDSFKGR